MPESETTPPPPLAGGPEPARGRSVPRRVALVAVLSLPLFAAVISWQRTPWGGSRDGPLTLSGARLVGSPFVGSRACRECHPGESAAHGRSGHARTLRRAGAVDLVPKIDGREVDDPEFPGVRWRYGLEDDGLVAWRDEGGRSRRFLLDYALGSGQHAVTFVSLKRDGAGPPTGVEHRLTYFARGDALGLTPGQSGRRPQPGLTPVGFHLPRRVVLDCFECHGTRTAPPRDGGLAPETLIPNITCERCHGPGRAHVEAARGKAPDPAALLLPFGPDRATADAQLQMCGHCHRLAEMVPPGTVRADNPALARFPSVGLAQSACYRTSAGALSCTTCHDPHARTSRDPAPYEATCRSCHPAPGESPPGGESTVHAAPCPVDPRARCIGCHMPRRDVGQGLAFSDHWIRVPDRAPADASEPD